MTLKWNGDAINARVEQAAARGTFMAANLVRTEAIRLILRTPKSGRTYTRRGVTHQASAPGEAPASDTGALVGGIRVEHQGLSATIISSASQSKALEHGTSRMRPRPFMRPALFNKVREIEAVIAAEIRSVL